MSSWLNPQNFTSLAKSALSEAQKTIDKALDIESEGPGGPRAEPPSTRSSSRSSSITSSSSELMRQSVQESAKLWGSLAGSFYGTAQSASAESEPASAAVVQAQPALESAASPMSASASSAVMTGVSEDEAQALAGPWGPDPDSSPSLDASRTPQLVQSAGDSDSSSLPTPVVSGQDLSTDTLRLPGSPAEPLNPWAVDPEVDPPALPTRAGLGHLLDEAMVDNSSERPSDSSSSRSYEVVKNSSWPTSGQTSGDELETHTTSSDIEVIHSPSLAGPTLPPSPRRAKPGPGPEARRGHHRTNSELSAAGSIEGGAGPEVDRLLKKLADMNDILESRESKMVEMSRANMAFQEKNMDLSSQIKEAMKINAKLVESNASNEDLTQRLAALENKLQRAMAERDTYLNENQKLQQTSSSVVSENDLNSLISEKDEIIEDLRAEGQKLSIQVGKHTDIIKKLRVKEKSSEKEIKQLKTNLEDKTKEADRLKKSLNAKDEVESKQIEAIQNLTSANSKWEDEHRKVISELEDATEKASGLKMSLEGAYKEMAELKRGLMEKEGEAQEMALSKEMVAKQALQEQLRDLQDQSRQEKESLYRQIDELRSSLADEERAMTRKEDQLRREREDLMLRLEQAENRHEELSGSVSAATRPLLRQIESLQSNLSEAQISSERVERSLSERLQQASIQLAAVQERERTASEQYMNLSSRTAGLETKLNNVTRDKTNLEVKYEEVLKKREQLEEQNVRSSSMSEAMKKSYVDELNEMKREKDFLEAALDTERQDLQSEKRKLHTLQEQLKEKERKVREIQTELDLVRSTRSSPSPSLSHLSSVNGSYSEMWPKASKKVMSTSMFASSDEVFDSAAVMRNAMVGSSNLYDTMRQTGSTAALVENLQAQLKQRDGELIQMQMEMGNLERTRDNLTSEVTRLTQKMDALESIDEELVEMQKLYHETEAKYQTMLTMYGEKVEETEELRLDLQDVKEMYKTQIQEVLLQQQQETHLLP